jgi:hypothetical protein
MQAAGRHCGQFAVAWRLLLLAFHADGCEGRRKMMLVNGVSLLRWSSSLLLGPVVFAVTACEPVDDESTEDSVVSGDAEMLLAGEADDEPLVATGPSLALASQSTLAFTSPRGLIASTGNLYWTSTSFDEFGPDSSVVWRASKGNTPGSEFALYSESGDDRFFGAIVHANPGAFFGYFVANYIGAGGAITSQIKRVPLTGGPAVVIANSPAPIATRDLVTDGSRLYWVDAGGIRSVALSGGAITTLRSSTVITRLRVDANFIYYGEEFLIFRMPKAGGFANVVVSTNGRVSALHVDGAIGWLFWGEIGGRVHASPTTQAGGGAQITYQNSISGRDVSAVGWDGSRPLWTDCAQPGNTSCRVMKRQAGINQAVSSGGVGVAHLQWDAASLYWGDAGALRKFVH